MPPRRQPTHRLVQLKLRINEKEHRRLAAAAEANHTSLNAEAAHRLAQSFEQGVLLDIYKLHDDLIASSEPLLAGLHEQNQLKAQTQTTEELINHVQRLIAGKVITGVDAETTKQHIGKIQTSIRVIAQNRRNKDPRAD